MHVNRIVNRSNLKAKLALARQAQLLERFVAVLKERDRISQSTEHLSYDV